MGILRPGWVAGPWFCVVVWLGGAGSEDLCLCARGARGAGRAAFSFSSPWEGKTGFWRFHGTE